MRSVRRIICRSFVNALTVSAVASNEMRTSIAPRCPIHAPAVFRLPKMANGVAGCGFASYVEVRIPFGSTTIGKPRKLSELVVRELFGDTFGRIAFERSQR